MLGPLWLTMGTLLMVVVIGVVYGVLLHADIATYLPYLALGLIVWQTFSNIITKGCEIFLQERSIIQQVPIKRCGLRMAVRTPVQIARDFR